jgi:hypothetical protein
MFLDDRLLRVDALVHCVHAFQLRRQGTLISVLYRILIAPAGRQFCVSKIDARPAGD